MAEIISSNRKILLNIKRYLYFKQPENQRRLYRKSRRKSEYTTCPITRNLVQNLLIHFSGTSRESVQI